MSKIDFEVVSISNFLSFGKGPFELVLNDRKSTLVMGKNEDIGDDGESTNGVGKTTMFQAVVYAIYGVGIEDKIKGDGYINLFNGKKMLVELRFSIGKDKYVITRGRKPNILEFTKNGASETRSTMDETTKFIIETIGIPYDVFVRTFFTSPYIDPFMAMTPAKQRDFMESLLSLDVLANRAEVLSKVIKKELEAEYKVLNKELEIAIANNDKADANIKNIMVKVAEWDEKHKKTLNTLREQVKNFILPLEEDILLLSDLEEEEKTKADNESKLTELRHSKEKLKIKLDQIKEKQSKLQNLLNAMEGYDEREKTRIENLQRELDELPTEEQCLSFTRTKEEIKTRKEEKSSLVALSKEIEREASSLASSIRTTGLEIGKLKEGKCPYCEQSHFDHDKVANLTSKMKEEKGLLAEKEQELEDINNRVKILVKEIKDLEEDFVDIDVDKVQKERTRITIRMNLPAEMKPDAATIQELKDEDLDSKHDAIVTELKKIEEERENILEAIEKSKEIINEFKEVMVFSTMREIDAAKAEHKALVLKRDEEDKAKNPYIEELARMSTMLVETIDMEDKLKDLDKRITHVGYLSKLLTDPKSFIRKNIIDLYIPFVNKRLNLYAEEIGLPHVVEINSDMTVTIEYMGKEVSYFNMSRGERLRLNVSTTKAFIDLLGMLGKTSNLLMIDELLDAGSDESGCQAMFRSLQKFADDVFIVSHRNSFNEAVDRVLTVVKKNGFSDLSYSLDG